MHALEEGHDDGALAHAPSLSGAGRVGNDGVATISAIDAYALSCEHGAEKPDPRLFEAAPGMVDAHPDEALMVGDRHTRDGGAAASGITTLILP
ncbi:HAD hydrolase-like protein [Nocardiopsis chromatogenes]|uniref:HAD hydrolase-like protein n=1 Tax=Nocardiopsis chromatogenes TaxID=280239 RepID=UPI001267B5BB